MGWTSENVARDFNISREDMDELAALSFQRAEAAAKQGFFDREIVPFTALQKDAATGERTKVVVSKDDGIRPGTTKEGLLRVRPAFPQWLPAHTTGGNASQITDGAAAVLLMTRRKAEELQLPILAKHVTTSVAGECFLTSEGNQPNRYPGLAPRIMGIGPSVAIPLALQQCGLVKEDVDLFEVCLTSSAKRQGNKACLW
jgi:acetyl-CoA acyltransferase 1